MMSWPAWLKNPELSKTNWTSWGLSFEVKHSNKRISTICYRLKECIHYTLIRKYPEAAFIRFPVCSCLYVVMLFCRNCSDRVVMLEASVETYKRKLESLGDLKRQMKLLEENNMTYMQNTVSLEEELRKANAARAQLETYKRQVGDTKSRVRKFKFPYWRWAAPLTGYWNKPHPDKHLHHLECSLH